MYHEITNTGTPQENRVAKCLNRMILEMMRTMLLELELPKSLWTFAVSYTQHILNRLPTRALDIDKTPYEVYHQRKPSVAHLRVFRCNTYVHVPDENATVVPGPVAVFCMVYHYTKRATLTRLLGNVGPAIYVVL